MRSNAQSLDRPYWVLVVDTDGMVADAYESVIERAGGRPVGVGSSQDAIVVLQHTHIDAVLLDVQLPVMDGMRLLQWMNEYAEIDPVKIVMSHNDNPQDIMKAYELGADRYVLKSWVSPNDLITVLNKTLAHNMQSTGRLAP